MSKPCIHFAQGRCRYGNNCRYSHDVKNNAGSAGWGSGARPTGGFRGKSSGGFGQGSSHNQTFGATGRQSWDGNTRRSTGFTQKSEPRNTGGFGGSQRKSNLNQQSLNYTGKSDFGPGPSGTWGGGQQSSERNRNGFGKQKGGFNSGERSGFKSFSTHSTNRFGSGANQQFGSGANQQFGAGVNQQFGSGANQQFGAGANQQFRAANQQFGANAYGQNRRFGNNTQTRGGFGFGAKRENRQADVAQTSQNSRYGGFGSGQIHSEGFGKGSGTRGWNRRDNELPRKGGYQQPMSERFQTNRGFGQAVQGFGAGAQFATTRPQVSSWGSGQEAPKKVGFGQEDPQNNEPPKVDEGISRDIAKPSPRRGRLQRRDTSPMNGSSLTEGRSESPAALRMRSNNLNIPGDVPFFKNKLSVEEELAEFKKPDFMLGKIPENIVLLAG